MGTTGGNVVDSDGTVFVASGGTTTGFVFSGAGSEVIDGGGIASATTLVAGGTDFVYSAGVAAHTTVSSGGEESVYAGGTVTAALVDAGGFEILSSGGIARTTSVASGGTLIVLPGARATATSVAAGGVVVSTGIVVFSGSTVLTATTAPVSGAAVGQAETAYVLAGGTMQAAAVDANGTELVFGSAVSTTVEVGGFEILSSGGRGIDDSIAGTALVSSGASLLDAMIDGSVTVSRGGVLSAAVIGAGGVATLDARGTASGTMLRGGQEAIEARGTATGTVVDAGGVQAVAGVARAATVSAGGVQAIDSGGVATLTTVSSGAWEVISAGGIASQTSVADGGTLIVLSGGSAVAATVATGGTVISAGVVVVSGHHVLFAADGSASAVSIATNDSGIVLAGGTATATAVASGGALLVEGLTTGTMLSADGIETVVGFGVASATMIDGGYGAVSAGGSAVGAHVADGGSENVFSGGTANLTELGAGGALFVFSGARESGAVLSSGGSAFVLSGAVASGTVVRDGGVIVIADSGGAAATFLLPGGSLDLGFLAFSAGGTTAFDEAEKILSVTEGGITATETLAGDATGAFFHLARDEDGGTVVTRDGTPCFCRGTLIMTDHGERPIETLAIGDRVVTVAGVVRPIVWIGRRSYGGRFAAGNRDVLPVLIRAEALGDGVPRRDLLVSPLHAMLLDGMLVPASLLVNGTSIRQLEAVDTITYLHIELESHDVILAEGAPAETFLDDDNRLMFQNAAEFMALYPNTVPAPVFCAPRLEAGAALAGLRDRLDRRAQGLGVVAAGRLVGRLDAVTRAHIEGWALDAAAPDMPVRLRVLDNGVPLGEVVADLARPDLTDAGIGERGFVLTVPGGLSPLVAHLIEVHRVEDAQELPNTPWRVDAAPLEPGAPILTEPTGSGNDVTCVGQVDIVTRERIAGWALDPEQRGPAELVVLDNGRRIAVALANRFRADLADAGMADGRVSFDLTIPGGLSPLARHVIQVKLARTGRDIPGSPRVLEAATSFDAALERTVADAVAAVAGPVDRARVLSFMAAQAERLCQSHDDDEGQGPARRSFRDRRRRAGPAGGAIAAPALRALIIDARLPDPARDGASLVVLSQAHALRRLGYQVSFAGAADMAAPSLLAPALEQAGFAVCGAPFHASVEDVLRRQAGCFDVVVLHRAACAARYLALARAWCPQARILYLAGTLEYLRLEQQAAVEERPELRSAGRRLRLAEFTAAWSADAVLLHAPSEIALLRRAVPEANVRHIAWDAARRPTAVPFARRHGVGLLANYAAPENRAAARRLVEEIMPLVWQTDPAIPCVLAGAEMTAAVSCLARPGVELLGAVADPAAVFDRVRVTASPMLFGGGVQAKLVASLAAGIPCVTTAAGAAGLGDAVAVGEDPAALAAWICRLHREDGVNAAAAEAGLRHVGRDFTLDGVESQARGVAPGPHQSRSLGT